MTNIAHISSALHSCLSLALLVVLFYYFWRQFRVDVLRQSLFELRAELFEHAAAGEFAFNEPAYAKLRSLMNTMIRFAHKFTLARVVTILIFQKELKPVEKPGTLVEWKEALSKLPAAKQETLRALHNRMLGLIVWHLISSSLVLMAISLPLTVRMVLRKKKRAECLEAVAQNPAAKIVETEAINAEAEEESEYIEAIPV
jgi:hypothetical protein